MPLLFAAESAASLAGLLGAPPPSGLTPLQAVSWWSALIGFPPVKALLPIPILIAITPVLYWFFRRTIQDFRPFVCFALTAVILTMQEYYGGRDFYGTTIRPMLHELELSGSSVQLARYDELYGYAWWVFARVFGPNEPQADSWSAAARFRVTSPSSNGRVGRWVTLGA